MITGRIITDIFAHFVPRRIEWLFASIVFLLGWKLLQPENTFASAPATYRLLAELTDETRWGWILFAIGGARLAALFLNGTWSPFAPFSPLTRSVTAFLTAGVWFSFALGIYLGNSAGTGAVVYGMMFVFEVVVAWEIATEAGQALQGWRDGRTS